MRKLVSKTRSGPRVTRRYDIASTPFHPLLDSGALSIKMTRQLQARSKNIDRPRCLISAAVSEASAACVYVSCPEGISVRPLPR